MSKPIVFDHDEIVRLTRLGLSGAQIAERVGCSPRQVTRVRAKFRLTQPAPETAAKRIAPERLAAVGRMVADGVSHAEIMRTLGVSRHTIIRHFPDTAWSPKESGEFARAIRRSYEKQRRAA